jgi:hypothetical protein
MPRGNLLIFRDEHEYNMRDMPRRKIQGHSGRNKRIAMSKLSYRAVLKRIAYWVYFTIRWPERI